MTAPLAQGELATDASGESPLRYRASEVALVDPLDVLTTELVAHAGGAATGPLFFWQHPERDEAMLAAGSACDLVAHGAGRIERVARAARRRLATMQRAGDGPSHVVPRVVGGFAFAEETQRGAWQEFPPCWLFVPRRLWIWRRGRCDRIDVELGDGARAERIPAPPAHVATATAPETDAAFLDRVAAALGLIERGTIEKVVLSRGRRIDGLRPSLPRVLGALRGARPGCVTFAVKPGSSALVGSTPELLVRRTGERFTTAALAGTMPRGANAAADALQARTLAGCDKNRREHLAVVQGIRDALAPLDVRLDPVAPSQVVAFPEAFHLRTAIAGRSTLDVLALAAALHPTPAVCGVPTAETARLLQASEPQRGWYTGGVGWMDAHGDGEVVVALRSALLAGDGATLFAGAGVVRGSQPDAELVETDVKMKAMLAALRESDAAPGHDAHDRDRAARSFA